MPPSPSRRKPSPRRQVARAFTAISTARRKPALPKKGRPRPDVARARKPKPRKRGAPTPGGALWKAGKIAVGAIRRQYGLK